MLALFVDEPFPSSPLMCVPGQVDLSVDQSGCSRQPNTYTGVYIPERILFLLSCH